jgi:hypothetical protein
MSINPDPVWQCENDACSATYSQEQAAQAEAEGFRVGSWCPACNVGTLQLARPECINDADETGCEGKIEHRMPLSGTGKSFPRCDKHWAARLVIQAEHNRRYPVQQPSDFDPSYAGERWDEED